MRIIAGSMRGTKLFTLDGLNTRPTLDRVKEPLFSIINFRLQDSIILDLFSGSGALGLESISRGAKKSYLCDNSKDAINIIKQNIAKTRTEDKAEIIFRDYKKALEEFTAKKIKFDIIFLDPPYKMEVLNEIIKFIKENDLIENNGLIVCEVDNLYLDINYFEKIKEKKYGSKYIVIYKNSLIN